MILFKCDANYDKDFIAQLKEQYKLYFKGLVDEELLECYQNVFALENGITFESETTLVSLISQSIDDAIIKKDKTQYTVWFSDSLKYQGLSVLTMIKTIADGKKSPYVPPYSIFKKIREKIEKSIDVRNSAYEDWGIKIET